MSGHGGKRDGAGRKVGAAHKKTRETADKIASDDGIMPLDVMVGAMRELWSLAESLKGKKEEQDKRLGFLAQAGEYASKAAPYIHPRLAAVEHTGKDGGPIETTSVTPREAARRLLFAVATAEQQETRH